MTDANRLGMALAPRKVVATPSAFGAVRELLAPAQGIAFEDHRYRAAMVQHLMATLVRHELRLSERTLPQFLDATSELRGSSADRHRRILRGETGAQYADLAFWSGHFPSIAVEVAKYIDSWAPTDVIEAHARDRLSRF